MDLITPDILKKILLQSGETDEVESVLSGHSEVAIGNGENYCSKIVRIHLKLRLKSGKIFKKNLIVKQFPSNLGEKVEKEVKNVFTNESIVYNQILNNLGNLAEKHNLNHPRIWPNCYFANSDVIILDDLKEAGYVLAPRQDGLKLKEALQVIRFMGRLHALSVVGERRRLINPQLFKKMYRWTELDTWMTDLIKKIIFTVGDIVMQWGKEWEYPGKKIMEQSNKMSQELNLLCNESVKLRVLNHGDIWTNNFMIKYDKDKLVETIRFVDFQKVIYNSVGWDLIYFLYSSLQGELMRSNYDRLLTSYRAEFVDTLKLLGEDLSVAPTMNEIKADLVRLRPFCLAVCCIPMAVAFNTSTHEIQADELLTNDFKLRSLFTSDNWKSSMQVHIKDFLQENVL